MITKVLTLLCSLVAVDAREAFMDEWLVKSPNANRPSKRKLDVSATDCRSTYKSNEDKIDAPNAYDETEVGPIVNTDDSFFVMTDSAKAD